MAMNEKWKTWFRKDNLIVLVLAGILLFVIALPTEGKDAGENEKKAEGNSAAQVISQEGTTEKEGGKRFKAELEAQLKEILSQMAGVGNVEVMITMKSSEELVVEKDEPVSRSNTNENDSAGGTRIITQVDSAESTVFRTTGSDSEPYVVKTISPQVEGVVVVAQGAGSGTVNQNITEMVQALFGVEAHKVKVVKMASPK